MKIIKKKNDKTVININVVMSILLVVVLSFISVGYALYNQNLDVNGTVGLTAQGKIAITNVVLKSSINVPSGVNPTWTDNSVNFDLTFEKQPGSTDPNYQAVYTITISNNTFYDFDFNLVGYNPTIYDSNGTPVDPSFLTVSFSGISYGDKILAGDTVTFDVTLDFNPNVDDTYTIDGELNTDLHEEPHGSLLGSIPANSTGDLRESLNHDIVGLTLTVVNSYQSSRSFTINITDTAHFRITDQNGNNLGSLSINGGETNTYNFYIKRVDNAVFASDSFDNGIYISYVDNSYVDCGNVTLLVDEQQIDDTTPPVISNVSVSINNATSNNTSDNTVGSVTVTWDGEDSESGVKKYYVVDNNGNTYQTTDSTRTLTITGLADGTYSFKVYGENNHGYKASNQDISSATTASGYCSSSTSGSYDWHYTVTLSGQYMKALTNTAVNRGYDYSTTLNAQDNSGTYSYSLPNTITVSMGGSSISSGNGAGQYTYSNSSGAFTVRSVTGDIAITCNANRTFSGCG